MDVGLEELEKNTDMMKKYLKRDYLQFQSVNHPIFTSAGLS